jgi:hypothetical protein
MNPGQDAGAKPLQVIGALLPFLSPGAVVRLLLFLALISLPLWVLLGCRAMGIAESNWPWILLVTVVPAWLDARINGFWHWGLITYATSAFFAIYVLGRFVKYIQSPGRRNLVGLTLAASALFFLHIVGPVIIIPALVLATLTYRPLRWRERLALAAIPAAVVLLNAFWFGPLLLAQHVPQPPDFQPVYPPDSVRHLRFGAGSVLLSPFEQLSAVVPIIAAAVLTVYGLVCLGRRAGTLPAALLGITCALGLFITLFGSDVYLVTWMQPVRFLVPTFAFMAVPVGAALASIAERLRVPSAAAASGLALAVCLTAPWLGFPRPLSATPDVDPVVEFVRTKTSLNARVMVQSHDGHKFDGYETKIFGLTTQREIIGSNFPMSYDPPQFLNSMLLGRQIEEWDPDALREALIRWGVAWVFTTTAEADSLLLRTLGPPVQRVGDHLAFEMTDRTSSFAIGDGNVSTSINRIDLTNLQPVNGLIVLRYRYHPTWKATPAVPIRQFEIPEDPKGFIALVNPPDSVRLEFDSWGMLRKPWPSEASRLRETLSSTPAVTNKP